MAKSAVGRAVVKPSACLVHPGAVLLDRPEGTLVWHGGSTRGFTTEPLAAAGGTISVTLLAATSPADGLWEAAADVLREVRTG